MKQGNGTDVLGVNHPRSASIGVIYVSPNDDRKGVLAAILTQEQLGRKQVAVVLPNANKAFQRPVDFDDLKSMRRKLHTRIVFIAPGGPGPAEFARQRRFSVYSSLENYAMSLQEEDRASSANKKITNNAPPQEQEEEALNNHEAPIAAEAVLVGAGAVRALSSHAATDQRIGGGSLGSSAQPDIDDADALPPVTSSASISNGTMSPQSPPPASANDKIDGPAIIELPATRAKVTVKLPAAEPPESSILANKTSNRTSGKIAAVEAGAAVVGTGGKVVSRAAGGGVPPARGNAGGAGAGGGSSRTTRNIFIAIALILLTLLLAFCSLAYAAPNAIGPLRNFVPVLSRGQPAVTITITPDYQTVSNSYVIEAVTGTPNASQRQVSARVLSAKTSSQQRTVNATGVKQIPAAQATGTLTFTNGAFADQTVLAGTVFRGSDGVRVANNFAATIPPANSNTNTFGRVTVAAHALSAGAAGNIVAGDINGTCCASNNSIIVVNSAFNDGQDAQNYTFVQQSDIDNAASPLQSPLMQQAQHALNAQIRSGEQFLTSPQCASTISADHHAGDHATSVTVTVSATCKSEVYDQKGVQSLVKGLLQQRADSTLGQGYALVGNLVTQTTVQSINQGNASLLVNAQGRWVYQISDALEQQLKKQIAGKSVDSARALLKSQRGIRDVDIQVNGNTLPTDLSQINIVVQNIPGLPGGGSGGVSGTPTVTGPTVGPGTQTPQPGLGGS